MPNVWTSVEDWLVSWNVPLQVLSLILAAGTIFIGALTIWAGKVSGDRQESLIATTNKAAATANEAAGLAMERAALVERDNLELRHRYEPRSIDIRSSYERMQEYRGMKVVLLSSKDAESIALADKLEKLFFLAEWKVVERKVVESAQPADDLPHGVCISIPGGVGWEDEITPEAIKSLTAVLHENGIELGTGYTADRSIGPQAMQVLVGPWPPRQKRPLPTSK